MSGFYAKLLETGSGDSSESGAQKEQLKLGLFSKEKGELLESLPIVQAKPEHRNYIISTWVRSYEPVNRRLIYSGLKVSELDYRAGESACAERMWDKCRVVVSPESEYSIHAWVCAEPGKLWHVYTPPALRLSGVAKVLVESFAGTEYAVSKPWPNGRAPKGHRVTYNPYLNG